MRFIDSLSKQIKENETVRKRIFVITLITSLFILILSFKDLTDTTKYLTVYHGGITGIINDSKESKEYLFNLKIIKGKSVQERSVKINKQAAKDAKQSEKQTEEENKTMEREAEIQRIITDIELSNKKRISLPNKLSDGSRLIWSLDRKGIKSFAYIPIIYLILVFLTLKSGLDEGKNNNVELRKTIVRGLPRFTNQLLLMLNAGVILSDAFEYICNSYELLGKDNMDSFQKELVKLNGNNTDHRVSTATLLNDYAGKNNVKDLVRISTILLENEKRGSDVIESLSRESRYLWDDRKIVARESGKMIDSKMAYPMGLLLLVLIIITMAPAIMNL